MHISHIVRLVPRLIDESFFEERRRYIHILTLLIGHGTYLHVLILLLSPVSAERTYLSLDF